MGKRNVQIPNKLLLTGIRDLIATGHTVTLGVKGDSMLPFLKSQRDQVILSPFSYEEIVVGDILLTELADGRFVLHRVIGVEADEVLLMGDGNVQGTEQATPRGVIGKVTSVVRNGRKIDCQSSSWRRSGAVWRGLRPVRRYLLGLIRKTKFV